MILQRTRIVLASMVLVLVAATVSAQEGCDMCGGWETTIYDLRDQMPRSPVGTGILLIYKEESELRFAWGTTVPVVSGLSRVIGGPLGLDASRYMMTMFVEEPPHQFELGYDPAGVCEAGAMSFPQGPHRFTLHFIVKRTIAAD